MQKNWKISFAHSKIEVDKLTGLSLSISWFEFLILNLGKFRFKYETM